MVGETGASGSTWPMQVAAALAVTSRIVLLLAMRGDLVFSKAFRSPRHTVDLFRQRLDALHLMFCRRGATADFSESGICGSACCANAAVVDRGSRPPTSFTTPRT